MLCAGLAGQVVDGVLAVLHPLDVLRSVVGSSSLCVVANEDDGEQRVAVVGVARAAPPSGRAPNSRQNVAYRSGVAVIISLSVDERPS